MHPAPVKGAKKAPPLFPPLHTVRAAFTAHGVPPIQNAVQASHEILASRRLSRSNCAKGRYQHIRTTPFPFNFIYEPIIAQTQTNYKGRTPITETTKPRRHHYLALATNLKTARRRNPRRANALCFMPAANQIPKGPQAQGHTAEAPKGPYPGPAGLRHPGSHQLLIHNRHRDVFRQNNSRLVSGIN